MHDAPQLNRLSRLRPARLSIYWSVGRLEWFKGDWRAAVEAIIG
jgi:hypothetical protein